MTYLLVVLPQSWLYSQNRINLEAANFLTSTTDECALNLKMFINFASPLQQPVINKTTLPTVYGSFLLLQDELLEIASIG